MESALQTIYRVIEGLPGNYMVFQAGPEGLRLLRHTCDIAALTGLSREQAAGVTSPYDVVLEDDKAMIRQAVQAFLQEDQKQEIDLLFRMIHGRKGFIWIHMLVKKYAAMEGGQLCVANLLDSTRETMIAYALMDASDRYVCVIEKASKRILYGNEKFYGLIGSSAAEAVGKHCYEHLCKVLEMRDNDNCLCYSSLNADPPIETYNPDQKLYLTITGREVVWGEYDAYVFYMTDITEKKQREAELEDSQKRFEAALDNSDLMVWEYDIVNSRCIASQKALSNHRIPLVIENYPESLYTMGHTPPETVEQIKECKRRLLNGETGFSVERRTVDNEGRSEWQKVEYTLECDGEGKPIRAIVCGMDITKQKEMEAKYAEQLEYRNKFAQNSVISVRLDLDQDTVLDYTCSDELLEKLVGSAAGASAFMEEFFQFVAFDSDSELSRDKLTKAALQRSFELGQTHFRTVCRCLSRNKYLDLSLYMDKNPGTKRLEVFFVVMDVTEGILKQRTLSVVASEGNDFVALIDVNTGKACMMAASPHAKLPPMPDGWAVDYDEIICSFAQSIRKDYQSEADFYAVSEGMKLAAIREKLENAQVYEFTCRTQYSPADIHTFRMQFTYLDESKSYIIYTRTNITKAVQDEHVIQQKLSDALKTAKEANRAKTDFLSRMSHDMRTPMNGIIGMTRLTQDIPGLPQEVQDNLSAISESSAYLLQLINDTLDMNKIESNRFQLNPEVTNVQELVEHVLSGIRPLASQKQIRLEFVPINIEMEYIRVDKVRIQQIFLNVLSNAVKFTPERGRIRIEMECLKRENGVAYDRISIQDNGCGMSQEFLEHIYEPFSQENTRIVNGQEGTGLGMSIVKSLVELMGGTIQIESQVGRGTRVTVYLNFERVYNVLPRQREQEAGSLAELAGKHVLLAEDHPLNATIATRLLDKKGMQVERAENGAAAVQLFRDSAEGHFDVVLMDIRMPVMDGNEAARQIRTLAREDAKKVPIIAMTANAYVEDVQVALEAGMNAHLAKPIEPELLYGTLERFL